MPTLGTLPSWLNPQASPPPTFALSPAQQQAITQMTPQMQAELKPAVWGLAGLLLLMAVGALMGQSPSSYEPVSRTYGAVQRTVARRQSNRAKLEKVATTAARSGEA
jgi:hypothetical protein